MLLYDPQVKTADRKVKNGNGHHRRRRRIRNGHRMAALRAFTAAMLYRENKGWNLAMAAASCGTNVAYVQALLTVLRSENITLLERVLTGEVSVLAAAREVGRLAQLVAAYRASNTADHVAFARAIGPGTLFDEAIVPAAT
jgi:hypothetical protein